MHLYFTIAHFTDCNYKMNCYTQNNRYRDLYASRNIITLYYYFVTYLMKM